MTLFRAFLSVSLDGYLADEDGSVGWLDAYMTSEVDFAGFDAAIGAVVMGRTTFEWSRKHGLERLGGCGSAIEQLDHAATFTAVRRVSWSLCIA